ncbi:hypothetical protein [Beijerinckia sp. L45]|uniref:hypothetical protein n=1 Tax=Beijerinckia sp. L45 TaxID=1641855 RepID=UPI00131DEE00|nr:hypothetical protein [Beijerinckia sp. L45]
MTHYDFPRVLQPNEAAALRLASLKAVRALGGREQLGEKGREQLVTAMMLVARSGYARAVDGSIDPDMLAEAAVARFRAMTEA